MANGEERRAKSEENLPSCSTPTSYSSPQGGGGSIGVGAWFGIAEMGPPSKSLLPLVGRSKRWGFSSIRYSLFAIRHSLLAFRLSPFAIRYSPFAIHPSNSSRSIS